MLIAYRSDISNNRYILHDHIHRRDIKRFDIAAVITISHTQHKKTHKVFMYIYIYMDVD